MKASELRVGNLVYETINRSNEEIVKITSLSDNVIAWSPYRNTGHHNHIEPIPLTEEWLLKFGFVSNPYEDRYELRREYHIYIEIDKTKGFTEIWCEKYPIIKHVHQLQNLYFALTGEEL